MKFQSAFNQTVNLLCMSMVQHEFKPELQFNNKLHEMSKSFHQVGVNAFECTQPKQPSSYAWE